MITIFRKMGAKVEKRHVPIPIFVLVALNLNHFLNFHNVVSDAATARSDFLGLRENGITLLPKCCEFGFIGSTTFDLLPLPKKQLESSTSSSMTMTMVGDNKVKRRIDCIARGEIRKRDFGDMVDDESEGEADIDSGSWTVPPIISSSFSPFNVTFKVHRPMCQDKCQGKLELHWIQWNDDNDNGNNPSDDRTSSNDTLSYEDDYEMNFQSVLTPEGYFSPAAEMPIYYPPTMYCLERVNKTSIAIELCATSSALIPEFEPDSGSSMVNANEIASLRKCCPLGQIVTSGRNGCTPISKSNSQLWRPPPFVSYSSNPESGMGPEPNSSFETDAMETWQRQPLVVLQSPATFCTGENEPPLSWTSDDPDQEFKIKRNGEVVFKPSTSHRWKNVLDERPFYCLDHLDVEEMDNYHFQPDELGLNESKTMNNLRRNNNDDNGSNHNHNHNSTVHILFFCGKSQDTRSLLFSSIYGGVMLASSVFLLIAAIINFLLWKKQNVHNWTVQAYIISLFFMYIFLGVSHIISQHYKTNNPSIGVSVEVCTWIGGAAHYFFLSTFCWLFMINFDLWWKFRKLTATSIQSQRARKQRFCLYVIFSTGAPATIITVGYCIQRFYNEVEMNTDEWLVTPNYGKSVCYMEETAGWFYLYGPICILLVFNLAFFISTIYSLYQIRKMTKIVTEGNHKNKEDQKYFRVKLFGKLFCIMGILWNFEVISFAVESKEERSYSGWYWIITDMLNIFQAIAIFYIFTWKRHVKTSLETQYPLFKTAFAVIRQAGEWLRVKSPRSQDPPIDSETAVASNSNTSNIDRKRSMTSNTSII